MQCPLNQGKEPGSSGSTRLWWHHPWCLRAGSGSWMDTRRHLGPQKGVMDDGWCVNWKFTFDTSAVCLDLLRLVHRVCPMPSSCRTWNWYRRRGQARRPWLGFWKNWEWLLSIQRQMLCFFIWMKSLSETNYTINPNKNLQRVLQVPLSSFHLFAEATFGHWPLIQSGSSRRWVVGVGVELLRIWSKTAVLKRFYCCTISVIWGSTWNFDTGWMFLTWCFWWVVWDTAYWATGTHSSRCRRGHESLLEIDHTYRLH